ncbi:MAG: hypothetical protein ACR2PQ_03880 [Myxococcota bacterium]
MASPSYGTMNVEYVRSWLERETDGPMWALNLMKYKEVADYGDAVGPEGKPISGLEADDLYSPIDELASVGARPVLVAPVVYQLRGDETVWDRIAIALYPRRAAMFEMNQTEEFQETHVHKEAGMDVTIVMGTFPPDAGFATDPGLSAEAADKRLLLQVVADAGAPDLAEEIESERIGVFEVEDVIVGDERKFAEARWDVISAETAEALGARPPIADDSAYALVIDPQTDELAASVQAATRG